MSYYSTVEFDITVKGITETEVKELPAQTLDERTANRLKVTTPTRSDFVSVVGYFDEIDTQWDGFAEEIQAFHKAVVGAGGAFRGGYVIRYGGGGDEERFIFTGTDLAHEFSEDNDTW